MLSEKEIFKKIITNKYFYILSIVLTIFLYVIFFILIKIYRPDKFSSLFELGIDNIIQLSISDPDFLSLLLTIIILVIITSIIEGGIIVYVTYFSYYFATNSKNYKKDEKTGIVPGIVIYILLTIIATPIIIRDSVLDIPVPTGIYLIFVIPYLIFLFLMLLDLNKRKFKDKGIKRSWFLLMIITTIATFFYYFVVKRPNRH